MDRQGRAGGEKTPGSYRHPDASAHCCRLMVPASIPFGGNRYRDIYSPYARDRNDCGAAEWDRLVAFPTARHEDRGKGLSWRRGDDESSEPRLVCGTKQE